MQTITVSMTDLIAIIDKWKEGGDYKWRILREFVEAANRAAQLPLEPTKLIQVSAWTCRECEHANHGLDDICQKCRTPKLS